MANERNGARTAIRVWLVEHNKTQEWLANRIRMDRSIFNRVLNGHLPLTADLADRLHRVTGLDLSGFVVEPAGARS